MSIKSATGSLHGRFVANRRTRVLARYLRQHLEFMSTVQDVGCGDGALDALLMGSIPDLCITGCDVLVRKDTKIPVVPFDGSNLPAGDKSFDAVLFVDVLHHTNDPMVLLREAKRIARKRIVIKDHTMDGVLAYQTLRVMDWVGNAPHGVALPYNYWAERRWRAAFGELGLKVLRWDARLGLYPFPASLVIGRGLHFIASLEPRFDA